MLGLVAGFFRGVIEIAIMRLMDIILTLPSLLLAIVIVAILGPGPDERDARGRGRRAAALRAHHARRGDHRDVRRTTSPRRGSSGAGTLRLMFKEVLPNCAAPLIVQASLGISTAILDAAALGFLGLGAQPPAPEWGTMLADAREFVLRAWWVVTFPGLMILVTVLAFNLLGDGLRDALDPEAEALTPWRSSRSKTSPSSSRSQGGVAARGRRRQPARSTRARCSASSANPAPARASPCWR